MRSRHFSFGVFILAALKCCLSSRVWKLIQVETIYGHEIFLFFSLLSRLRASINVEGNDSMRVLLRWLLEDFFREGWIKLFELSFKNFNVHQKFKILWISFNLRNLVWNAFACTLKYNFCPRSTKSTITTIAWMFSSQKLISGTVDGGEERICERNIKRYFCCAFENLYKTFAGVLQTLWRRLFAFHRESDGAWVCFRYSLQKYIS